MPPLINKYRKVSLHTNNNTLRTHTTTLSTNRSTVSDAFSLTFFYQRYGSEAEGNVHCICMEEWDQARKKKWNNVKKGIPNGSQMGFSDKEVRGKRVKNRLAYSVMDQASIFVYLVSSRERQRRTPYRREQRKEKEKDGKEKKIQKDPSLGTIRVRLYLTL